MLASLPLFGQSMTGTYRGTYTLSWPQPTCTFNVTGQMDAAVTQSGKDVRGVIVVSNYQYPTPDCTAATLPEPAIIGLDDGRNNNGTTDGDLIAVGLHPPFKGTFNGSTWSGATTGSGDKPGRMSFALTRIATDVRPVVAITHRRDVATATGKAWVYWVSAGATSLYFSADQTVRLFEHFNFNMTATKTFTLTAVGPTGLTSTASTTVVTARLPEADVVVSASPVGMLQGGGAPGATTSFTLTNFGGTTADVSLTQDGAFFTATPATFALAPLMSQVVTITSTTQQAGAQRGSVGIGGTGVVAGLSFPVTLLVSAAPPAAGAVTSDARREFSGPAGVNPPASLSFTNSSASTIEGLLSTDVAWIVIPDAHVTLGPGETKAVDIAIDRSWRNGMPLGGATGQVAFRHLSATGDGVAYVAVPVIDIVTPATPRPFSASNIFPGRFVFAPGASRKPSSFSDLTISNLRPETHIEMNVVYLPPGPANGALLDGLVIPASGSLSLPRTLQHVFPQIPEAGTLMTVGGSEAPVFDLALRHTRVNTSGGVTTVTSLPTFRSDQGYAKGADLFLTGLQKSDARSTTLYVQDMTVADASITIDFFNSEGVRVGASRPYTLARVGSIELEDVVPKYATTARMRNNTEGTLINAFALVFDKTSADLLPISATGPGTGDLFCPAFPASTGTREMFLYLANSSDAAIAATATLSEPAPEARGRRRAVTHAAPIETQAGPFMIPALGS
ncbi:MAG: hypothetical protein ACJ74H_10205, partial [Thermoanaerobaculia bacterium]